MYSNKQCGSTALRFGNFLSAFIEWSRYKSLNLLRQNSHGRHMSVYFAVYPTLVLAFRVAEVDWKLQLATLPSKLQPAVDKGDNIAADFYLSWECCLKKKHTWLYWQYSSCCSLAHAPASSRSRNCNVSFLSHFVSWHR